VGAKGSETNLMKYLAGLLTSTCDGNRAQRLPLSGGETTSIGGAGQSWSGRTTESSLSLRNDLG